MISVVIPTFNSERLLPRCFDGLISAAVRGVVREVIVADGGSSDATLAIADAAGARIVESSRLRSVQLGAGADAARSDWLLFLHPETALEPGWEMEVESFLGQAMPGHPRAAAFRFALEEFGGQARRDEFRAGLRSTVLALPYGDQGLLIPARLYRKLGGYRALSRLEDADLMRRIGRRRLVMLRSRAVIVRQARQGWLRSFAHALLHTLHVPSSLMAKL